MGLVKCFAEQVTAQNQAPIPDPLWREANSPSLFPLLFLLPRDSGIHPGGVGSQQEVDFARDQKRELGVSVEGRSLDCTENIRGVDGVPWADTASPHPRE